MGKNLPLGGRGKGATAISDFEALFWVTAAGAAVGVLFDLYRSLRRWMNWGRGATFMGDILFSFLALILLFRFFLKANALEFRLYIFWGSLLGLVVYMWLFSSRFTGVFLLMFRGLERLSRLMGEILLIPVKVLVVLMKPPYAALRWFSLLIYRIMEYLLLEPWLKMKGRIRRIWSRMFPPHRDP